MFTCNFSIIDNSIVNKQTVNKSVWLHCNICIVRSACINSISVSSVSSKYNVSVNVSKILSAVRTCSVHVSASPVNKIVY